LSCHIKFHMNWISFFEVTCLIRPHFLCPTSGLLIQVWLYKLSNVFHNGTFLKVRCMQDFGLLSVQFRHISLMVDVLLKSGTAFPSRARGLYHR
jgi:hypothetical protein